jgi:hypothetical protein
VTIPFSLLTTFGADDGYGGQKIRCQTENRHPSRRAEADAPVDDSEHLARVERDVLPRLEGFAPQPDQRPLDASSPEALPDE